MIDEVTKILRDVFGFGTFRPLQAEIIENVLAKKDTLAVMPTGGGKSLCYQLPALVFDGVTIVVSPLISLMKDQVDQLSALGVPVCMLNSSLPADVYRENMKSLRDKRIKILYIAPESLTKQHVLDLLSSVRVDCMAIDEAHCISFWGHEFRPEYRRLMAFRPVFADAVCLALTATATPRVQKDIMACLGFPEGRTFVAGFDRENLYLRVDIKENAWDQVRRFIGRFPGESGIIYCFTRKQVDALAERLQSSGFSAAPYHAGMTDDQRRTNQERFIRDDIDIVVATIAFGMGIDKPDIRFVLHFDLPKTLEHYYQEIGRAGRDGLDAECLLLLGYGDIAKIRGIIDKIADENEKRIAAIQLSEMLRYAETRDCRRIPLLSYFGDPADEKQCGRCDNCRKEKSASVDITVPAQKFLSCVKRTGERFGPTHVVDVLRGSTSKKVLRFGHDRISTHGIGADMAKRQWLRLAAQFLQQGLMTQDATHGNLLLTEKGWAVLKGKNTVQGYLEDEQPRHEPESEESVEYDKQLFQRLRTLRKSVADAENVPPYVIFPDKTLTQMAAYFPQKPDSLARIHGVGKVKLETFGPAFIKEIQSYCGEHGIDEIVPPRANARQPDTRGVFGKKRFQEVGDAFFQGKSIRDLAVHYDVKETTIVKHLTDYLEAGNRVDPQRLRDASALPEQKQQAVMESFRRLGTSRLRPIFDDHDGAVPFDDLHRIRLRYLSQKNPQATSK